MTSNHHDICQVNYENQIETLVTLE